MAHKHTALYELANLAKQRGAKLTLVFDETRALVKFKEPGKRAEVVSEPYGDLENCLTAVLGRFGIQRYPTTDNLIEKMSDAQLARTRELVRQLVEIKHDVMMRIEDLEPRLPAPRSSLDPRIVQGAKEQPLRKCRRCGQEYRGRECKECERTCKRGHTYRGHICAECKRIREERRLGA